MVSVDEYRAMAAKSMSEKHLQDTVLACARGLGYVCYHTFDARRSEAGFPDVVAVRPWFSGGRRILFIELKSTTGRLRPEQRTWRMALIEACAEYYLWRPIDWLDGTVQAILSGGQE